MAKQKKEKKEDKELQKKRRNKNLKTGFCYSLLTIALLYSLIQIGYGAIINISKIFAYQGKVITLERVLKQARAKNADLKAEKKVVTSDNSLEEIARNNLKMAGKDEVLIMINKKVEEPPVKKQKYNWNIFTKKSEEKSEQEQFGKTYIPEEVVEE